MLALAASTAAETLEDFAYQSGSDLGRALYCREPTSGLLGKFGNTQPIHKRHRQGSRAPD